jgi:fructokinase
LEIWVSGTGLEKDFERATGACLAAHDIALRAASGDSSALASLDRHVSRLGRGIAHVVNIIDPDVIVLGGGLSNLPHLYTSLPAAIAKHAFSEVCTADVRPAKWGDASGVRAAAWLWE